MQIWGCDLPEVPFFDCNARIGRCSTPRPEQFTDVGGLLDEMDQAGIERALVHHAWSVEWDPQMGNQALLSELSGQTRLRPCFVPLPPATGEVPPPRDFASQVRDAGGAVRLFPKEHQYLLNDVTVGHMLDVFSAERLLVLIDIGQTSWGELAELLRRHPALSVLVLGLYYRVDRYLYPLLERFGNLHVESGTYGVHRGIEAVCGRFGAERLVFGTDLPVHEAGGPIAMVTYAEIPDEGKQLIAGGNLRRLRGEVD
jgi:hypothetical protein